ncbi:MAG: hypothetical protein O2877_02680 [bacterium]|nr:hypothetical protein [bacterium]
MESVEKEKLLKRMKELLEYPGVCTRNKKAELLLSAGRLTEAQLKTIVVMLRIQLAGVKRTLGSKRTFKTIDETMEKLEDRLRIYGQ